MPTKQETFDTVVAHLRKQGAKAERIGLRNLPECVYRAEGGLMCAAGCLIPDDKYDPAFERRRVAHDTNVGEMIETLGHDRDLVAELQDVHDRSPVEVWEEALEQVAELFGLIYTPKGT